MNILILGEGGRENAIAWKIAQSSNVEELYIAPGNAGTALIGKNIQINITDFEQIKDFALSHNIDMIIVGPEAPLVKGITDFLSQNASTKNIKIIGPSKEGARLEGSKDFAKKFMAEFNIPTAKYKSFGKNELEDAYLFLDTLNPPYVLKADGLAAGKGVLIIDEINEAKQELKEMFGGRFGEAGDKVVIEEFLKGIECSVFVLVDDTGAYKILPVAKDYKRIGAGDVGLNTGGMGAVSPVSFADEVFMQKVEERIIKPTVNGILSRRFSYKGFIFIGLISVDNEPYVIEYNVRLGDPETEVVIPRIKSDLLPLLEAVALGKLKETQFEIDPRYAVTVMMVAEGYPNAYKKGDVINGLESIKDSIVFQAGTICKNNHTLTNGGRVLAVTSYGKTLDEALRLSYKNIKNIEFRGSYFRQDIGFDLD